MKKIMNKSTVSIGDMRIRKFTVLFFGLPIFTVHFFSNVLYYFSKYNP